MLIAAAATLLISWIAFHTSFEDTQVPVPLSGEAMRNPFYGAIRFSEALGAEASWERVFAEPRSDAVIMLSSWNWTMSRPRRERIEHWVEGGGRLIVDDSLIGGAQEFERWSGVGELEVQREKKSRIHEGDSNPEDDGEKDAGPSHDPHDSDKESLIEKLLPKECDPLTEDSTHRLIHVCGVNHSRSLTSSRKMLWALRDGQKIHALRTAGRDSAASPSSTRRHSTSAISSMATIRCCSRPWPSCATATWCCS